MKRERVILFDLGRVLIDFDHRIAVRRITKYCTLSEEDIYNLFFDSDITDRYERGLISSEVFFEEVKTMLGASISYSDFLPIWNEIFSPHPGMLALVRSLKDAYKLYMVSNINALHSVYLRKQFSEYFKYFQRLFLSYELKLRKPDEAIYTSIINVIQLPPQHIIYIDDRLELVEAAQRLGIDAFVFESTDSCKRELIKRDIICGTVCPQEFQTVPKKT